MKLQKQQNELTQLQRITFLKDTTQYESFYDAEMWRNSWTNNNIQWRNCTREHSIQTTQYHTSNVDTRRNELKWAEGAKTRMQWRLTMSSEANVETYIVWSSWRLL